MRVRQTGLLLVLLGIVGLAVLGGFLLVWRPVDDPGGRDEADRSRGTEPALASEPPSAPGVVSGTVRVFRTDAPAADVGVRIEGAGVAEFVRTDEAGVFFARVPSLQALTIAVEAPPPYAPVVLTGVTVEPGRRQSLGTLYLEQAFLVTGQVVDRRGRPVEGARVRARRPAREEAKGMIDIVVRLGEDRPALEEVVASGEGVFTFRSLTPGTFSFEAEADGFAVGFKTGVIVTPEMGERAVRIVLGPGASLAGTVEGEGGRPLEGARVTVLRFEGGALRDLEFSPVQALTDADGKYAFANLTPGRAAVMVTAPGYPLWMEQSVDVGRQARLDIALSGLATIAGKVEDSDGDPVPEADVSVILDGGGDGGGLGRGTTDESGEYRIEHLPEGSVRMLIVQKEGYPTWPDNLDLTSMGRGAGIGTLRKGETLRKDVTLGAGTALVGRVVDAGTSRPIAGAEVRIVPQIAMMGMAGSANAVTDDEGAFRLEGLGLGSHLIVVRATGYSQSGSDPRALMPQLMGQGGGSDAVLKIEEAGVEIQREIRLERGARITGRVLTPDGRPVASARISVKSEDQFAFFAAFMGLGSEPTLSGEDGRFSLGGLPADRTVRLEAEAEGWVAGVSDPVTPATGAGGAVVEIRLRAPGIVAGTVVGADGRPLEGASVAGTAQRDQPWMAEQALQMAVPTITDGQGRFRLGNLAPGRTLLRVEADGHVTKRLDDVQVTEGETTSGVDVRLEAGLVLQGEVQDEAGEPVAGARVWARVQGRQNQVWDSNSIVQTGLDGRFELERLATDVYQVSISKEGYIDETREGVRAGTTGLSILLRRGLVIAGRVSRSDGRPAVGVFVRAESREHGSKSARTDPDGTFRIDGLRPGSYTVVATPFGDAEHREVGEDDVMAGTETIRLRLEPGRSIAGTVVDSSGAPVAGASVWAMGWEGAASRQGAPSGSSTTDAGGAFTIHGLDGGSYRVRVHREGQVVTRGGDVMGGATEVRVVLGTEEEAEPPVPRAVPVPEGGR